jgi:pimeloyl-ACP methyl ester carboxylesterase
VSWVTSRDRTSIAFTRVGSGLPVVLVNGALGDRSEYGPLADALAPSFTVYIYDRRGRGESGDVAPYAVDREIEDLAAVIVAAGGTASVYGHSAGAGLVLEAAAAGVSMTSLAVYEVPYTMGDGWPHWNRGDGKHVDALIAQGLRGDAVEYFMRSVGTPDEDIAAMRSSPVWPMWEAMAHTLAYDAACLGDGRPAADRLSRITQPTLLATGRRPPGYRFGGLPVEFFDRAADAVAALVPSARPQVVEGQGHMVEAAAIAPVLERFFHASANRVS